jgi:hypothetical protein
LKRAGFARCHDRRALEQILQIVIAVPVQPRMEICFFTRSSCPPTER